MRRIRALAEERNPSKSLLYFDLILSIWRPLKFIKIHDTLKLHLFSVIYHKIMPNANGYSIKTYSFHETSSSHLVPRRVKLGVRSGLTEARCRDTNVFLDSWLLHRGYDPKGQKDREKKRRKFMKTRVDGLVNQTVLEGILLMDKIWLSIWILLKQTTWSIKLIHQSNLITGIELPKVISIAGMAIVSTVVPGMAGWKEHVWIWRTSPPLWIQNQYCENWWI